MLADLFGAKFDILQIYHCWIIWVSLFPSRLQFSGSKRCFGREVKLEQTLMLEAVCGPSVLVRFFSFTQELQVSILQQLDHPD